jgi:hypothetical protein
MVANTAVVMHSDRTMLARPQFLFIFGAAGSGNTFMFNCLAQDPGVYGINEDAFGATLERLLQSEREMGKCPHSVSAFVAFLRALRRDRPTLVLKTPSNLRRVELLRKHLPQPRFICMVREPHAAIASGLERHNLPVREVADLWRRDAQQALELPREEACIVSFEALARDPAAALLEVSRRVFPLSPEATTYALRVNRPERADAAWWQGKVPAQVQAEIRDCVTRLRLTEMYFQLTATDAAAPTSQGRVPGWLSRPLRRAKREVFRGWYRLVR